MYSTFLRNLTALVVLLAPATGCGNLEYRPSAVGQTGEVVVVTDSILWQGQIGEALRAELERYIETLPAPEKLFDLKHRSIASQSEFDRITASKNVVFAASLGDSTTEANFVRSVFSPEARTSIRNGQNVLVERQDTWRRDQRVVYLAAGDNTGLVNVIRESGPRIRAFFNEAERIRLDRDMFESGRQRTVEDTLLANHDFRVRVQHDYLIAIDTTDFLWLRRILPDSWRSVFVHYEENADPMRLTPDWIYRIRDSLSQIYIEGNVGGYIAVDRRRPLETEQIDFLDRYGFETRGLWHMVGPNDAGEIVPYGMGGPFVNYSFYDQESGRIFMIDGMVFAPGFKKREFLRQLEVIAYTFATRQDLESQVVAISRDKSPDQS